ncbi:MAG: hypothetical protein AAF533_08125 [Acidobacteriota bacterium]
MKLHPAVVTMAVLLLASSLMSRAPDAAAASYEHPDFTEGHERPARLLVLPPVSSISRSKINESEPLIKETRALEDALAGSVSNRLTLLGYEVVLLTPEEINDDPRLADWYEQFLARALETASQASVKPKDIRFGRFSIGDHGFPLADRFQVDGAVLLNSQSLIHGKGKKALFGVLGTVLGDPLAAARGMTRTQLLAVTYDLRDGQLLSLGAGLEAGKVLKKPEAVAAGAVHAVFADYPAIDRTRRVKPKFRQKVPRRELTRERASTDDVLSAFDAVAETATTPEVASPEVSSPYDDTPTPPPPPEIPAEAPAPPVVASTPPAPDVPSYPVVDPPTVRLVRIGGTEHESLTLKNMCPDALRVSVNGEAWSLLEPGAERRWDDAVGSHELRIARGDRDEQVGQGHALIGSGRSLLVELWPTER